MITPATQRLQDAFRTAPGLRLVPMDNASESAWFRLRHQLPGRHFDVTGYWSYPALVAGPKGEVDWLTLIFGTVPRPEDKATRLFRPKAILVTRANHDVVVSFQNLRFAPDPFTEQSWDQPLGRFPHEGVASLTYEALQNDERRLLEMTVAASETFRAGQPLSPEFRALYLRLGHPICLGFLKHLAPHFLQALGAKTPLSIPARMPNDLSDEFWQVTSDSPSVA